MKHKKTSPLYGKYVVELTTFNVPQRIYFTKLQSNCIQKLIGKPEPIRVKMNDKMT